MQKTFILKIFFSFVFLFSFNFVFAALEPPTLIYPALTDSPIYAGEIEFKWGNTGANFYKYHINLPTGSAKEEVINSTSKKIYDLLPGDYSWAVSSCNDAAGQDCGAWNVRESFQIISAPIDLTGGLVPCGRQYDNPLTQNVNEAEPCQIKHIFLLMKNVLDFLLWRMGPLILVLLFLMAGVSSFFAFGSPAIIVQLKSLLKSSLMGYGLIFLAWLIINWILVILGFQVGIFGRWWQIIF